MTVPALLRLALAALALIWGSWAAAQPLQVPPDQRVPVTAHWVSAMLEPKGARLSLAEAMARSADFRPTGERREANPGSQSGGIWLRVPIESSASGPEQRILLVATNFMSEMTIWLEHDGQARELLNQSTRHPFSTRPIAFHQLAAPLMLPPGPSTLWVRYRSEGSTAMPLSIETPASFMAHTNRRMAIDFSIYGIITVCALAGFVAAAITRRGVFLAYGAYATAVMAYIMQREGHAFRLFWPNAPIWNEYASLPLGLMLVVTAALFSRSYLELPRYAPWANRLLWGLVATQAGIFLASLFVSTMALKELAILTTTLGAILFLIYGLVAMRRAGWRYIFYVLGWFGFVFATVATVLTRWAGVELTRAEMLAIMSGAMLFDGLMMGLALVGGVILLRRERDQAMQARLAAQDQSLELMQRLSRLERNYEIAQVVAEASNRALADTGHDLRQPLFALRSAMADLASPQGRSGQRVGAIVESLDYMEQLVDGLLASASAEPTPAAMIAASDDGQEDFDAAVVLTAMSHVHGPAADAAGRSLVVVPAHVPIRANPLALLRILGNLVANAIQHGAVDKVVVGARREGRFLRLEVHNRAEPISPAQLAALQSRHVRGADDGAPASAPRHDGHGLGLSIVDELARQHQLRWTLDAVNGGVIARLWVPCASAERQGAEPRTRRAGVPIPRPQSIATT